MPDRYTAPATTTGCACGCGGCPSCHGLRCLCRPRFFAGQLVTDADFRRLDDYLVGKDRLHNRHLHGTGVVCGLEVVCSPCDDTVTVRPGYALGPCGEDIVVGADTRVDVGKMIRELRRAQVRDCAPFRDEPAAAEAAQQKWVLGVCYDEQPAKAVAALLLARAGAGSCGCGGGTATTGGGPCGCGGGTSRSNGGGHAGGTATAAGSCGCGGGTGTMTAVRAPVACEPTVICEGFRFVVTKAPAADPPQREPAPSGTLATRVKACLTSITERITQLPVDPDETELLGYCATLRAELREIIETSAVHDCRLGQRLAAVPVPVPGTSEAVPTARRAVSEMLAIAVELFRECLCSALLPPCPDDCADDCVPIATLTVRTSDLQVLEVCNWGARRFAVTLPMLGHWLGWTPIAGALRRAVETLCCPADRNPRFQLDDELHVATAAPRPSRPSRTARGSGRSGATADTGVPSAVRVAAQQAEHSSALSGLEATLLRSLGAAAAGDQPLAADAELDDPLAAFALARLLGPTGTALLAPVRDQISAGLGRALPPVDAERLDALEKMVATLRKTVSAQARTITDLRKGQRS